MAEKLLYLTNVNSDISLGDLFYKSLRPATGSAATINIALEKNIARIGYGFSFAEEIDLRAGAGAITVQVNVTTADEATCRIRANRISSTGTVLASSAWTATQSTGTTGVKTFTTESIDWTGANATDRLRIDYEFITGEHSASVSIQIGVTNASVETPFTNQLDISVDATGGGTTSPAPGIYDYVVAGREVIIEATPADYTKVFDKWVINSQDVFENPTTVTMTEDKVVVAHFKDADQYDLIVNHHGEAGTSDPAAGTHTYYEGQPITITGTPTNEDHSVYMISAGEYIWADSTSFTMPAENVTVDIHFITSSVYIERKDGPAGEWFFLAIVSDPDVLNPNDYDDQYNLQDSVEYFYRAKRYEGSQFGDWSNEDSIIYAAVTVGDTTVSAPCAEVESSGLAPAVSGQRGADIQAVVGEVESLGVIPAVSSAQSATISSATGELNFTSFAPSISATAFATISAVVGNMEADGIPSTIVVTASTSIFSPVSDINASGVVPIITTETIADAVISAVTGSINIQGFDPVVSVQKFATVQSTVGEIEVDAVPPNVVATQNAHIINLPPPVTEFEGLAPTIVTAEEAVVSAPCGEISAQGLAPAIRVATSVLISPPAGAININGLAPVIQAARSPVVSTVVGTISAVGLAPTMSTEENATVSGVAGIIESDGLPPTASTTKVVSISAAVGSIAAEGAAPAIVSEENVTVSAVAGALDYAGEPSAVSTTKNPSIQAPVGEVSFKGKIPSTHTAANAEVEGVIGSAAFTGFAPTISTIRNPVIEGAVGEISVEGPAPVIGTTQEVAVRVPVAEIAAEAIAPATTAIKNAAISAPIGEFNIIGSPPTISSTIGAPVLTASQPDGYIYVEWEVV